MKRIALVVLCCVLFSGGSTFAQCFGSRCFSTIRVSSFGGGLRGRLDARRFQRDISSAIRTQNALNSLAIAQSFVAPQIVQSFIIPQVQSFSIPSFQSYALTAAPSYVQSAPSSSVDDTIPRVTTQLRQLQEMTKALNALRTE